jgi:hypothetical protein
MVEALDGMNKKFANPYIIFFPTVSRDGMPFPINKCIREMQGRAFSEETAWRGNIVIAKYRDNPWTSLLDATMADFPLLRNYLMTHGPPPQVLCLSIICLPSYPFRRHKRRTFVQHTYIGRSMCFLYATNTYVATFVP